jgi:hypothetical protein
LERESGEAALGLDHLPKLAQHKVGGRLEPDPIVGLRIGGEAPQSLWRAADPICLDIPAGRVFKRTGGVKIGMFRGWTFAMGMEGWTRSIKYV